MSTKLDSPSVIEARHGQSTASISVSSTVSASSPKVSKFGAKAGFVIPKNKLSGSLVPIFRGGSKGDSGSMGKEESTKQFQRKTKWGADLTQDAAVRKGKLLAYQTRMEQITQQLKSGSLKFDEDQGSESPQPSSVNSATDHDDMSQKVERLELERREIIGEILRLNPSYKAPADYKPLLKESKVPIPIKSYSGYNFIGLLLGPESNTQKRLEEETGAKVRVYGTKSGSTEKREITKSDISEAQVAYEDLYVHLSADTYEKVDTAVALIELLLTPVSGTAGTAPVVSSSPAANNADLQAANQDSGFSPAPVTVPRPSSLPVRPGQQPFQLYPPTWFQTNVPPHPSSTFMPPFNPTQFPVLRIPPGAPQYFSRPPNISTAPRTSSPPVMRPPLLVQLAPRQSSPVPIPQSVATLRSPGPVNPQIGPPVRPFVPAPVNFSGWGPAPTAPNRPMAPPSSYPSMRPPPAVPSAPTPSGPQFNVPDNVARPPTNFAPHPTPMFSSQPSTIPPNFSPVPSHIGLVLTPGPASSSSGSSMPPSPTPPPTSLAQIPPSAPAPAPAPASFHPVLVPVSPHMQGPIPLRPPQSLPATPTPNSSTILPIVSSPVTAPKPLRPISGDFTFQPLRTQPPPASPVSHSSGLPFAAPKAPSFRPASQNPIPGATVAPNPFPAGATNIGPPPPMLQGYPHLTPARPGATAIPVSPPSFSQPPSQAPNPSRPPPAYPSNFQQANQIQMIHLTRPRGSFTVPIQPMPGNAHTSVGGNQIYDPFSPTASSAAPHQGTNAAEVKKPETDSEYEDLMASVGVK